MNERKLDKALIGVLLHQEFRKRHAMEKEIGRGQCKRDTTNRFLSTCVFQLSRDNEREGLSDCMHGLHEKEQQQRQFNLNALAVRTATYFLIKLCLGTYECDHESCDRQAASDRQHKVWLRGLLQVST